MSGQNDIVIAFLGAAPEDLHRIRPEKEAREIQDLIVRKNLPYVKFISRIPGEYRDLQDLLTNIQPQIFHLAAHRTETAFYLEQPCGENNMIQNDALIKLISDFSPATRCVILSFCNSISLGQQLSEVMPYVIAIDGKIVDDSIIEFSKGFYQALLDGFDVQHAFDLGQIAISAQLLPGSENLRFFSNSTNESPLIINPNLIKTTNISATNQPYTSSGVAPVLPQLVADSLNEKQRDLSHLVSLIRQKFRLVSPQMLYEEMGGSFLTDEQKSHILEEILTNIGSLHQLVPDIFPYFSKLFPATYESFWMHLTDESLFWAIIQEVATKDRDLSDLKFRLWSKSSSELQKRLRNVLGITIKIFQYVWNTFLNGTINFSKDGRKTKNAQLFDAYLSKSSVNKQRQLDKQSKIGKKTAQKSADQMNSLKQSIESNWIDYQKTGQPFALENAWHAAAN